MKLQVTQENLNRALSNVSRVASNRATLPILANIMLKTIDNRLSITATNLNIAITQYIGSKISKEGSITVPARLMQDFINSLPNEIINLELEDNKLHVTTDKYNSVINGVSSSEFPVMPAISGGETIKLSSDDLKNSLQQVIFSASNDETRPVLNGVHLHSVERDLNLVATDSYRLAEKKVSSSNKDVNLLIPATSLQELSRILTNVDEEIKLTYDEQQVLFSTSEIELVTRLIDGTYPDVHKLIPNKFSTKATIDKSEFLNIAKVSSLFARETAGSITINVDENTKSISIHSIASQLGENTATTNGKIKGSGSITLNSRYLLDGLQAINSDTVEFCFNGKLELAILKDPKSDDYVHGIMPLKS